MIGTVCLQSVNPPGGVCVLFDDGHSVGVIF